MDTSTSPSTSPPTSVPPDLTATVDRHLAAYCEPDAATRAALVTSVWSTTGSLIDPPFDGTGHEAIAALTDVVLQHYPAHRFERTTAVDAHHGIARYGWALIALDGSTSVSGIDVAEANDDGRLTRVVGFFGDLQPPDTTEPQG